MYIVVFGSLHTPCRMLRGLYLRGLYLFLLCSRCFCLTCVVIDVIGVVTDVRRAVDESSHHLQKKVRANITFIHSSVKHTADVQLTFLITNSYRDESVDTDDDYDDVEM